MTETHYEWSLYRIDADEDGDEQMYEAAGSSPDIETAMRDAAHYAVQYSADYPVRYEVRKVTTEIVAQMAFGALP